MPVVYSADDGDYLDDGMERPDAKDIPALADLVKDVWSVSDVTDPADYLDALKARVPEADISSHDPATLETVFAIPVESSQSTVLVTVAALGLASGDHFKFSGSIDGVNFSGDVVRYDDQIHIQASPEFFGQSMKPYRFRYFIRQHPETQGGPSGGDGAGDGNGDSQSAIGPLEVTPSTIDVVCKCCPGAGECTPTQCGLEQPCAGGTCKWVREYVGPSSGWLIVQLLVAASIGTMLIRPWRSANLS